MATRDTPYQRHPRCSDKKEKKEILITTSGLVSV